MSSPATATLPLYAAIFHPSPTSGIYHHWALFLDCPSPTSPLLLQALGSSTRYRFAPVHTDPRSDPLLAALIPLCSIPASRVGEVRRAAEEAVIHNEAPGYNCQDYVLELMEALEERGVVDGREEGWVRGKEELRGRVEGLV